MFKGISDVRQCGHIFDLTLIEKFPYSFYSASS